MRSIAWRLSPLILILALPATAAAGEDRIISPEEFLGFQPGQKPASVEQIDRYFEHLAKTCPRARLETYATSYEQRPLVYLVVSSEHNLSRLKEIRKSLARLADPRDTPRQEIERIAKQAPAVAWMAFSIHGDELSGSDAAVRLAYRLCTGQDELARLLRRELIVIIDPVENPDGRFRTLSQMAMLSGRIPNSDRASIQHSGLWPWGRWNHYWFDPNRDYLAQVHPETRGRVSAWLRWTPQLVLDAHEMWGDSSFLFSPPRHPFNPHLPAHVSRWLQRFARDNAAHFDRRGRSYYTRSWNEEFFMGYGSGWPKFFGAIGILHEQAGSEGAQLRQRTGRLLDYRLTVEQQLDAALSNLESLARNRREILEDFADGRREAVERGRHSARRAWLIPPGRDSNRTRLFLATLLRHGIEIQSNPAPVRAERLHDAWSEKASTRLIPAGSYLVRADQPLGPLVHNLLDFHQPMSKKFLSEERRWLERRHQSRLYETTAWSLPLAFGVEIYWTDRLPGGKWASVEKPAAETTAALTSPATQGYLFSGSSDGAIFLAARLLEQNFSLRVANEPFKIDGRSYKPGSFLLRREENPKQLDDRLKTLAEEFAVELHGLSGDLSQAGPDLGSDEFEPLIPPRIAVLAGFPIAPPAYGEIWHLLDRRMGERFSGLELAWLSRQDLERYNVIVLPPCYGGPSACAAAIGKKGREKLAAWVRQGGSLVAIGSAAAFVAGKDWKLCRTRPRAEALDRFPPIVLGLSADQAESAGRFRGVGVRATAEDKDKKESGKNKKIEVPEAGSPYDVEPLVGPAARAFLPTGTGWYEIPSKLVRLDKWIETVAPKLKKKELADFITAADERLRRFHPSGAMLRVDLDNELWLAFGCPDKLAVNFHARDTLVADHPAQVPARFAELGTLHLSGLLWPEAAGRIARTAYLSREQVGRGQVILFADDPVFRAVSWASQRLFLNALVLGPGLGTQWPAPL